MEKIYMDKKFLHKTLFILVVVFVVFWFAANLFFGEHVNANHGFGWDGLTYAKIAEYFPSYIHNKLLTEYRVRRIFPSFVVFLSSKIFGYSLANPENIVHGFYIYNVLMLFSGMYALYLIAQYRSWRFETFIIAFSGMFLNFGILKMTTYYTVLTDYSAFALGIWMIYFYLKKNKAGLSIITVISGFTFSTSTMYGCLLLLFPSHNHEASSKNNLNFKIKIPFNPFWVTIPFSLLLCFLGMFFLKTYNPENFTAQYRILMSSYIGNMTYVHSFFIGFISLLSMFLYVIFSFRAFLIQKIIIAASTSSIFFFVGVFAFLFNVHYILANHSIPTFTFIQFFPSMVMGPLSNPLIFVLGAFIYYGPIILFVILYWNKIVEKSNQYGFGFFISLGFFTFLSLIPESRDIFNGIPLIIFLLSDILNQKNIKLTFSYFFMFLSLLFSKFWFPINRYSWGYSMNQGQGIPDKLYIIQMIMLSVIFLFLYLKKKNEFEKINLNVK